MEASVFEVFPTKIIQFDVSEVITHEVRSDLVAQIDSLCEITTENGPIDTKANPSIQSKTFLFDEGSPECFKKLKETFLVCCNNYLEQVGQSSIQYVHSRAWFFKTWADLKQKNDFHNHVPAVLSGVFYLKGADHDRASGTIFENPNYTNIQDRVASFEPKIGSWIIFPGNIYHKNDDIKSNIPRYVVAADFFGCKV
jgi:hypothetical protein